MPRPDTGPDIELMKPIFRSAADAAVAAAATTAATQASRKRVFIAIHSRTLGDPPEAGRIRGPIIQPCGSGHQLPLPLFELDHHPGPFVHTVAAVRIEVVDAVGADEFVRAVDGIVQRDAKLRRSRLCLGDRKSTRLN